MPASITHCSKPLINRTLQPAASASSSKKTAFEPVAAGGENVSSKGRRRVLATLLLVPSVRHVGPAAADTTAGKTITTLATDVAVPELSETFASSEGFNFNYPADWVVAFDRSGTSGAGAVCVVGNFAGDPITVAVFRSEMLPKSAESLGINAGLGKELTIESVEAQASTMRLDIIQANLVHEQFVFEYVLQVCRGEVLESQGGRFLCLGPYGNELPTQTRHVLGQMLVKGRVAYTLSASTPEHRWTELQPLLTAVVQSFCASVS